VFQVAIRVSRDSTTDLIMAVEKQFGDRNYGLQIGENHGSLTAQFHIASSRFGSLRPGGVDYLPRYMTINFPNKWANLC
jgi:hypothetical protein